MVSLGATSRASAAEPAAAGAPCAVAIVGVTVIDGNGGPARGGETVLVQDGKVAAVGPRSSVNVPGCARTLDGKGKYLTPGFIDTNVHVAMPTQIVDYARYYDRLSDLAVEGAQLNLKYGVTSIRDSYGVMAPLIDARERIKRGEVPGARLFIAGNIVGWGGTFSRSFRGKKPDTYFEEWANDQVTRGSGELIAWQSPDELRKTINTYMDQGVDFVKIGVTDHDQNWPALMFSPRQLKAMVEEIHKRGLVAEVHATSPEGMVMSMDAGVDLIQHPEVIGVPITDEVLAMLDRGKTVCSIHTNNHAGRAWEEVLEQAGKKDKDKKDKAGKDGKTADAKDAGRDPRGSELRNWKTPERTQAMIAKEMEEKESFTFRENAQKILKTRCILTTATDDFMAGPPEFSRTPNKWHPRQPGLGTLASIEGLVELGLTPAQALTAGTKNGAIALKMGDRLGTIEQGKLADLVLLDADPLKDIRNIRRISQVIKDGVLVDRERLPLKPVYYRVQQ